MTSSWSGQGTRGEETLEGGGVEVDNPGGRGGGRDNQAAFGRVDVVNKQTIESRKRRRSIKGEARQGGSQ